MPSDPTSVLFEALRVYLMATNPRFEVDRLKLIARDGSKVDLHVVLDMAPASVFVPSPFQEAILEALDGKALKTQALGAAAGDKSRLYKPHGLQGCATAAWWNTTTGWDSGARMRRRRNWSRCFRRTPKSSRSFHDGYP